MSLQTPVLQIAITDPHTRLQARKRARWAFVAAFASLVVAIIAVRAVSLGIEKMEKRGAGLLLVYVLLEHFGVLECYTIAGIFETLNFFDAFIYCMSVFSFA
jgi:hypothetical protein